VLVRVEAVVLAAFAALVVPTFVRIAQPGTPHLFDFHTFWEAGRAYLHGRDPYPLHVAGPIGRADWFVYPAPVAALFAPLALLPYATAWVVFAGLLLAATCASLWLLGVRDVRCYAAALCALPVLKAVNLGAVTPLLALGVAASWRLRDREVPLAIAVGAVAVTKLFLWPLLPWLWFTGRRRAAAAAAVGAAAATLLAWVPLGAASLERYPSLLHQLSLAEGRAGYGIGGVVAALGGSATVAAALPTVVVPAVAAAVRGACRRLQERDALAVTVAVAVAASPVVWQHYFALAVTVVALRTPAFSARWLLPAAYWCLPHQQAWGSLWRTVVALGILAACAGAPDLRLAAPRAARYVSATVFSSRAAA
jgi:hypothetical protein